MEGLGAIRGSFDRRPSRVNAASHAIGAARQFARNIGAHSSNAAANFLGPGGAMLNMSSASMADGHQQQQQHSPEEVEAMWELALVHFGGMRDEDAREIAVIFSGADLPAPSTECAAFMSHEFLISLGITAPGDRARVLLTLQRMPPPSLHLGNLQVDEHQLRFSTHHAHEDAPKGSYSEDTTRVQKHIRRSTNVTWIDLVGKDAQYGTPEFASSVYNRELTSLQREIFTADVTAGDNGVGTAGMPGAVDPSASAAAEAPHLIVNQDEKPRSPGIGSRKNSRAGTGSPASVGKADHMLRESAMHGDGQRRLNPSNTSEQRDIWSIMKLETPLPHMVIDPDHDGRAAFILRVCTTGANISDASFGALTNRWLVVADSSKNTVAIVHRVDSVALAALRDKDFTAAAESVTFKGVLSSIFVAFLMEFEVALDKSNALLDDCETHMLDHTQHNDLLESLFHLERKASVYERMIDLNHGLTVEIGQYFHLSREIAYLEPKWLRLREKAVALQERSTNMLQLLLALSGHRTNELMAVLTRFSLVFTPMTFVAGVYGMNFKNMPELNTENGYFVLIGVMLAMFIIGVWISSRL